MPALHQFNLSPQKFEYSSPVFKPCLQHRKKLSSSQQKCSCKHVMPGRRRQKELTTIQGLQIFKKKKKKWQEGSSFLEGTISFSEQTLTFWYHPGQCLDAWLWGYRSQCQDLSWTVKKVTFAAVTAPFKFFNFTSKKARKFKNAYNSKNPGSYR